MDDMLVETVSQLYALVFIIGLAGYMPQIICLIKVKTNNASMSLSTWSVWTLTWAISLMYGYLCLDDMKFCMVAGMNLIGHMMVISLVCYNRRTMQMQVARI